MTLTEKEYLVYITTYSTAEIYLGFQNKEFKETHGEKFKLQKEFFSRMLKKLNEQKRILSLNVEDSKVLGELFYSLQVIGNPIPIIDAIIGAIGLSRDIKVITTDQTHFSAIQKVHSEFQVEYW